MRIDRLRLVNFRQHADSDLRFDSGLTGIIGPNGSGKSTLAQVLAKYPRETKSHWRTNSLLSTVVFPGLLCLVLGLPFLVLWIKR